MLRERTGQEYLFLLVEHTKATYTDKHEKSLAHGAHEHGVPTLHLTPDRWEGLLSRILQAIGLPGSEQQRIRQLLSPRDIAYSAGPNKAFLVAATLGVDTLHRRDSDHVPDRRSDGIAFPGVLEAAAIGQPLNSVSSVANSDAAPAEQVGQPVYFVGSSMFGDPPHDRRDLLSLSDDYVINIEKLSSPRSTVEELRNEVHKYFIEEPAIRYDSDFYELDLTGRTELGVSCLQRIFLELPEMPIQDTLGCDYFQKNLLYQLGRPVLFHSRKMRHSYDTERASGLDLEKFILYSLRDLRYLILWRVWSSHNRYLRTHVEEYLLADGSLNADRYARGLASTAEEVLPQIEDIPAAYSEVYTAAARQATGVRADRLQAVADAATKLGTGAIEDVRRGLEDYTWLIVRWKGLIRNATSTREAIEPYIVRPSGERAAL